MRVVFAGTPAFASPALEAIVAAGHEVPLVLTQPDRPAGRGMRLAPSDVAATALRLGLQVEKPPSLRATEVRDRLAASLPAVIVVAAYGLILPRAVLDIPPRGCLNIHASLLPRWRGAAPIHRALLAGDERTGVSIMQMDEGLDTGAVLLRKALDIDARETTGSLTAKLADLGVAAIIEALASLDSCVAQPQDAALATYALKIDKSEAMIDWRRPALEVARRVRAFNPAPGAEGLVGGVRLKIWEAEPIRSSSLAPGAVEGRAASELVIGCGEGALRPLVVQRAGGRRMPVVDFLRGNPWPELAQASLKH